MNLLDHLHPATVHFPIALLLLASLLTLVHLFRRPAIDLRLTIWLLLGLGWLGGGVAVLTGLLAQLDLPPDAPYRTVLNFHISAGLAVLVLYGFLLYRGWLFRGARARKARERRGDLTADLLDDAGARAWIFAVVVLGALLIVATGWYGGQLVYQFGVNVSKDAIYLPIDRSGTHTAQLSGSSFLQLRQLRPHHSQLPLQLGNLRLEQHPFVCHAERDGLCRQRFSRPGITPVVANRPQVNAPQHSCNGAVCQLMCQLVGRKGDTWLT